MTKRAILFALTVCAMLCCSFPLFAQQLTITGTVRAEDGKSPLNGVTVSVKNGNRTTQTGTDGKYSIVASIGQTLQFSFVGYALQEVEVGKKSVINITMSQQNESLNDVVVVGYGTQRRANLTGSVTTVNVNRTLKSRPITDLARGLQGAVPGLTITTPSGDIGTNPQIRLRGMFGSLNGPGAIPLILVDNVEFPDLRLLNPDDIESISVLKDAASTSLYGTRGAWGVILITTRTAKLGGDRSAISYSNNFSWNKPTITPKVAPIVEGTEMMLKANQRANPTTNEFNVLGLYYSQATLEKMKEWQSKYGGQDLGNDMVMGRDFDLVGTKLFFYRPWDPMKMYMREYTPQQSHNINFSGTSGKTGFTLGLGYLGQKGVLKVNPDEFQRFNATLGVTSQLADWFTARGKVVMSRAKRTVPYLFSSDVYDPWYYITRWPAFYPYGTYEGKPFRSSITEVEQASMIPQKDNMSRISLGGTFKLIKGLTVDLDYTYHNANYNELQTGGTVSAYNFWAYTGLNYSKYTSATYDRAVAIAARNERHALRGFATYTKKINDHSLKFILGTDAEKYEVYSQRSERRGLINEDFGEVNLATGDQYASSSHSHWATLGYVGRVNYAYKDKYLLEVNGRYDGSSSFPRDDQWAFFPSMSLGYLITEEKFMDFSKPILSSLKLRGSLGNVGNQSVGGNKFLRTMNSTSSGWFIGGANQLTFTNPPLVSSSLSWEKVQMLDIGADARLFNNTLGVTFDWYRRTTSDIISNAISVPSTLGTSAPVLNFAELRTTGWEVSVDWYKQFNNGLLLGVMGNVSDFKEVITKFANDTKDISSHYSGKTMGEIWGYTTDRFFTKDDFEQDGSGNLIMVNGKYVMKPGVAKQERWEEGAFFYGPGDIKYADLNKDGKIDIGTNTVSNPGDQHIIGNSTPRYQYALRLTAEFKGFDIGVFFQGVGKRDLWASGPVVIPGYRPGEGWYDHQLDYWTPERPDAYYPRPTDHINSNGTRNFLPQTKYLLNMAYTRLKVLNFGYKLPQKLIKRAHLNNVRVYVSGENLITWDHLRVPIDPEVDYTTAGLGDPNTFGRVYPYHKSFSAGIQISF
ncbi:TonB-dependent receptor [Pseudoflavitalea sp. G-6-1-2]|uniref:SusC/RagA family TonB-linked outer membrane protein n=1 Tax=Pseudoflavitalea sp. G-6-1-2 TaxID=2728841 RepID=UPI00146ADDC1|nr:TonB-dependent receptor [Pseudoflavitalea sp. G-6-1-2]NML21613.1 TonB-dependent receptor [Pseudoflavitalea sp. G-6-1-2]